MLDPKAVAALDSRLIVLLRRLTREENTSALKSTVEHLIGRYEDDGGNAASKRKLVRRGWRENWQHDRRMFWGWFDGIALDKRVWLALQAVFERMIALVVEGTTPYLFQKRSEELEDALSGY